MVHISSFTPEFVCGFPHLGYVDVIETREN